MIDTTKKYTTVSGLPIIGLTRVEKNSAGAKVSAPIKGTVVMPGRQRNKYTIWQEDGKKFFFTSTELDIALNSAK